MAFSPQTGEIILRAAQGLTQTIQLQQQLVQRQQEREEAHSFEKEKLRLEAERNEARAELDKIKIEREQLGVREQRAETVRKEAFAGLVERFGLEGAEQRLAAARSSGRGGKGAGINFSARVESAVSRGAQRALASDLQGGGDLATEFASKVGLSRDAGRISLQTKRRGKTRNVDVNQVLPRLGISNPADLTAVGQTLGDLRSEEEDLQDLTKFINLTPNQRQQRLDDIQDQIAVGEAIANWSLMNQLNRSQEDLLRASGDAEILNLQLAAQDEPFLRRTAVVRDMPGTMSTQAKDRFFSQLVDTEPSPQKIIATIRQHYPKTPEGAIDFTTPEIIALGQALKSIHGDDFFRQLAGQLTR